jgi:sigma-E factor negative regulatory protein RseB
MRKTLAWFSFVIVITCLIAYPAYAQSFEIPYDRSDAQALLKKMQSAAQKLNYAGIFVYQQGNQVRTSRITHLLDGKNEVEKLEVLDGNPREYIRNNEEITYYAPETKTLLVERRTTQDVFAAIIASNSTELTEYYNIQKKEAGRVAGFDCQIITLSPTDHLRYGYKLWSEKRTGLLLRAQTLNHNRDVVEQIAFTQIEIGNIDKNLVKPSFTNTAGWRRENAVMAQLNLSAWTVKAMLPGFKKIREFKRIVSDAPSMNSTSVSAFLVNPQSNYREVAQIVFSDGLAAISLFIEPSAQHKTEGSMQQGAMNIITKRQDDHWLTIVGEVPLASLRQVANSIEFKSNK